jgi:uroporphyrinogen decarboxylase
MTSRERVLTALGHRLPDRTPSAWGFGPTDAMTKTWQPWLAARGIDWAKFQYAVADTLVIEPDYTGPALKPNQPLHVGVWGIETKTVSYGPGAYEEFVGHPLAGMEKPSDLDRIQWPSPGWFDYDSLRRQVATHGRDKAIQLSVQSSGNPFEIYTCMTGMEEAMLNLLDNPELVEAAHERICAYFEQKFKRCVAALDGRVDLAFFADDLGGQTGLLISRETYRQAIQPFHRRLIRHGRQLVPEVKAMFHTDGAVFDILPDVIDAGVDVLEAVQTDAAGMDPVRLKDAYGDRLSFHGGIAVQSLLPHSDAATVRQECCRLCEVFGRQGGYIAAPTHAIQAGTPPENIWAMLEVVLGEAPLAQARATAST